MLGVLLPGCGSGRPKRVPVAGQVLIDGEPLKSGFIRVVPDDARPAVGEIRGDGHFRLTTFGEGDGCVLGTHRVAVISREVLSPTAIRWLTPRKYHQAETSQLEVTIDGPQEDLKINLEWGGEEPTIERFEGEGDADPADV